MDAFLNAQWKNMTIPININNRRKVKTPPEAISLHSCDIGRNIGISSISDGYSFVGEQNISTGMQESVLQ
jgi:hypothetical protein